MDNDLTLARHAADRLLTTGAVAARAGVAVSTISTYLARGYLPAPVARISGRPLWTRGQIDEWLASRPGRGAGGGPKRK